jgi:hypothetical protein
MKDNVGAYRIIDGCHYLCSNLLGDRICQLHKMVVILIFLE